MDIFLLISEITYIWKNNVYFKITYLSCYICLKKKMLIQVTKSYLIEDYFIK